MIKYSPPTECGKQNSDVTTGTVTHGTAACVRQAYVYVPTDQAS